MEQKPTYEELEQKVRELEQQVVTLRQNQAEPSDYRQIVEHQPELVCRWLPDTTLTFVNNSYAQFFDRSPREILGLKWIDFLPETEKGQVFDCLQELTPEQPAQTNEHFLQRNDGEWRWFVWTATVFFDDNGNMTYGIGVGRDITERKRAEQALQKNKERFHWVMEATQEGIWDWDLTTDEVYYSPAYAAMLGYTRDEVPPYASFWLDHLHPEDKELAFRANKECIENRRKNFEIEFRMLTKNGEVRWIWGRGMAVSRDEQGRATRLVGTHADITQRKQMQEELHQSENYYRTLFETSGSAMLIVEEDMTVSLVNSNFEELSEYSKHDIEGKKSWPEFVHSDDVPWMKEIQNLRQRSPEAAPRQYECRFITRSGETRIILLAVDLIPETERSIASCIDITEQRQKEEEIDKSEKELQTIFNTMESGVILVDKDGFIIQTNKAMTEMLQYDFEDLIGSKYIDHVHETETGTASTQMRQLMDGELDSVHLERLYQRSDETTFWGSLSGRRLYHPDGSLWGLVGVITDITERKQMEVKLKKMSFHDSLTGLYNRNFFEEEMKRLSDGRHNPLGIIVCDLDGLKFVNDTLGHEVGDHMLGNIAEILRKNFRSSDIIARIGGDEFAVLLPETDLEVVEQKLQRLRQSVQDYNSAEPEIPLSLSLGHALDGGTTTDMHELFREADNRMYREKIQREGSARNAILQALLHSMQARDFDTEGHCDRLQELAASMARSLNLSQEFVNDLYLLARFHDLGKVGIPDHILFKPGSLTEEEWQQMRQHCEIGHRIASSVPDLEPIADYILKHHEWWDGRGYPWGLSGEDIPLPCRILAIADAYDAMTSDRPYRRAMTREEAIAEIRRFAGTQFDPELVEQFIQIVEGYSF